jgi:hypothetical protein
MSLLQKGPKYNIHAKRRNWIQSLALEAETSITQLPNNERDAYRKIVADRIHTLQKNSPNQTHKTHHEARIIGSINKKLRDNEAMTAGTDEANSIVILHTKQYESKIQDFLPSHSFSSTTKDPTNAFQTKVKDTIKLSSTLIPKDDRWKYSNLNPSAPILKGRIKLHKPGQPIRLSYWRGAWTYKLSKLFIQKVNHIARLPNTFNINTTELLRNLQDIPMHPHYKLALLDISNLYSIIPRQSSPTH